MLILNTGMIHALSREGPRRAVGPELQRLSQMLLLERSITTFYKGLHIGAAGSLQEGRLHG